MAGNPTNAITWCRKLWLCLCHIPGEQHRHHISGSSVLKQSVDGSRGRAHRAWSCGVWPPGDSWRPRALLGPSRLPASPLIPVLLTKFESEYLMFSVSRRGAPRDSSARPLLEPSLPPGTVLTASVML